MFIVRTPFVYTTPRVALIKKTHSTLLSLYFDVHTTLLHTRILCAVCVRAHTTIAILTVAIFSHSPFFSLFHGANAVGFLCHWPSHSFTANSAIYSDPIKCTDIHIFITFFLFTYLQTLTGCTHASLCQLRNI